MSVEREFVYKTLVENLQYPAAKTADCMFDINCSNYQLYDELAKHNAFKFGDYTLDLDKRITYKFKYLPLGNWVGLKASIRTPVFLSDIFFRENSSIGSPISPIFSVFSIELNVTGV